MTGCSKGAQTSFTAHKHRSLPSPGQQAGCHPVVLPPASTLLSAAEDHGWRGPQEGRSLDLRTLHDVASRVLGTLPRSTQACHGTHPEVSW